MDSDAWKSLENAYAEEFKVRYNEIGRHWNYYEGNHDLPLKVQKDGYNDNVVVNHVEALADRLTAFLIGDGVRFDAGTQGSEGAGGEGQSDDDIALLWQQSRGAILQESIALSGAIEGHCAIRLAPRDPLREPQDAASTSSGRSKGQRVNRACNHLKRPGGHGHKANRISRAGNDGNHGNPTHNFRRLRLADDELPPAFEKEKAATLKE